MAGSVGDVAGVFQAAPDYLLNRLVSAFSGGSGPTSQAVKYFCLTVIFNFYFLETEVTIMVIMVTSSSTYLPTYMGGCFQILTPLPNAPRV